MQSLSNCPNLPCPVSLRDIATSRTVENLKALLNEPAFSAKACKDLIAKFPASHALDACSDVLFYLLHQNSLRTQWDAKPKLHFLTVLHELPQAAEKPDNHGFLPLHYLLEEVEADLEVIYHLVMVAPKAISVPASTFYGSFNCLQLALMREDVDFKLVMMMLSCCPELASIPTGAGKYPLHLALSDLTHQNEDQYFYRVIKKLLVIYPTAVSLEVTEEVKSMRLRTNSQGGPHNPVDNVYSLQVRKYTWSPINKVRSCRDTELQVLFEKFLEAFSWRRLQSQWRV
eukprot:gene39377-47932_t